MFTFVINTPFEFSLAPNLHSLFICCWFAHVYPPQNETFEKHRLTSLSFLESDASDLFLRAAYNGRFARLHLTVRGEDTREVQCSSDVSHKTEAACHPGGCQGMRMGGFPSQRGDTSANPLYVQEFSCE